jgi:hypothetical protein
MSVERPGTVPSGLDKRRGMELNGLVKKLERVLSQLGVLLPVEQVPQEVPSRAEQAQLEAQLLQELLPLAPQLNLDPNLSTAGL